MILTLPDHCNAVVVFIVQCFFIRRILGPKVATKHWLAVIFSAVALITLGGAMFFGINGAGNQTVLEVPRCVRGFGFL